MNEINHLVVLAQLCNDKDWMVVSHPSTGTKLNLRHPQPKLSAAFRLTIKLLTLNLGPIFTDFSEQAHKPRSYANWKLS